MNNLRILLLGFTVILATLVGGSTAAHTQRSMLVLIDASGSMNIGRSDPTNPTRFAAAKSLAISRIINEARLGLDGVAVYTFSGTSTTAQTTDFVDPNSAIATINGLDLFTVGGGSTPLAGSICDAVDVLVARPTPTKILQLASDGEENTTPLGHQCQGPFSTLPDPPYSSGSWQNKVLSYVVDHGVTPNIDLFDAGSIVGPVVRAADPEAELTANAQLIAPSADAATGQGPPTLRAFFTELARAAGGRLTVINDRQPQLPVFADLNSNSCVDRSDALLVARAFGQSGSPQENPLDLDLDGKVGFADYALAVSNFTPGGCGTADPFVSRAPLVCSGPRPIVIDGQAIEDGGIAVDTHGACHLIIRNSLIVSGQNAIDVRGNAVIEVENSIIIGEDAILTSRGTTSLSGANSVFHGIRTVRGAFQFLDRGGNVLE